MISIILLLRYLMITSLILTIGTFGVRAQSDFAQELIGRWNNTTCTEMIEFFADGTVVFTITTTNSSFTGDYRIIDDTPFEEKVRFDIAPRSGTESLSDQYLLSQLIGTQVAEVGTYGFVASGIYFPSTLNLEVNGITYSFIPSIDNPLQSYLTDRWMDMDSNTTLGFQQGNSVEVTNPDGEMQTIYYQSQNDCFISLSNTIYSSTSATIVPYLDTLFWFDGANQHYFQRFHIPSVNSPLEEIAYVLENPNNLGSVYTIDPSNFETQYLISVFSYIDGTLPPPQWSGDGNHLVVYNLPHESQDQFSILRIDANTFTVDRVILPEEIPEESYLMLSPRGTELLFFSYSDSELSLNSIGFDSSNRQRLGNFPTNFLGQPVLSPDGTRIAYVGRGDTGGIEINVVNVDGSNHLHLSPGFTPNWSPDSRRIVYSGIDDQMNIIGIFVMNSDGKNITQITQGRDDYPAWSPDGQQIVFASARDGNRELYLMNADGSNQRRLTNTPEDETFPSWRPNQTSENVAQLQPDFSDSPVSETSAQLMDDITRTVAAALNEVLKAQGSPDTGQEVILLIQASGDLTSIASQGLDQLGIVCAPVTAIPYLQSVLGVRLDDSPLYVAGDYVCTYGQGIVATLTALSTAGSVPFALVPILLQPEKYVDPWLDPINEAAWRLPITCSLFPDAVVCR